MKKTTRIVLLLLSVLMLCALLGACTVPVMEDAQGNPTWAGLGIQLALEILTYLAITLVSVSAAWLTAKIGKNKDLQNVKLAIGILEGLTRTTAGELKQTISDDLKAAQGGKLKEEQKVMLQHKLLSLVKQKADSSTINTLKAAGADINKIILGAAEDWVGIMHKGDFSEPEVTEIPPLEDWPLDMLFDFCEMNAIPHEGCQSREDYIDAIVHGGKAPEGEAVAPGGHPPKAGSDTDADTAPDNRGEQTFF